MKFDDDDGADRDRESMLPTWKRREDEPLSKDQSSLATRTQVEFTLPGSYPPCQHWIYEERRYCLSTERMIVHLFSNSGKKLMCSNEHNHPHKGSAFISPSEFGTGGEFVGILDPEFVPSESKIIAGRWKVSKARQAVLSEFRECALCGAQPFQGGSDKAEAWTWIEINDLPLFEEIKTTLRTKTRFDLRDWFLMLPLTMQRRIQLRLEKSTLSFDHSIPRKTGNAFWELLSVGERSVLQEDLVFKLCRQCNLGKSARLEPREAIEVMFVKINFSNSLAAAKADARRWSLFHAALNKVYGEEKIA